MPTGDIYIYGVIRNEQSEEANSAWGEVSLTSVKNQIKNLPDTTDELLVHIHSNGGDVYEGFAIHDHLINSGKKVTTRIEGMCASIATVIALAGSKREMTNNSTFMIHNPSMTFAFGDADDLEKAADYLREIEDRIINFYSEKTGQTKEALDSWMKEEKFISPDEAKELGFITDIIDGLAVAAVLRVEKPKKVDKPKNKNEMGELDLKVAEHLNKTTSVLDKLLGLFKGGEGVKNNLTLNSSDGSKLEIVTDKTEPNPGDKVTIDGKAAEDKEYTLMDKTVITVKDGKIESVKDPEGNEDTQPLEVENAALKAEIEDLKKANQTMLTKQDEITAKLELIATEIQSQYVPKQRKQEFNTPQAQTDESPAARAIRLRKEKADAEKKDGK